ncbi:class I SAM-dependent methyltransferase [Luteitalea sp.]|jgi:SAM-dependent methyltransferase|uniref:class I SAM-dependent methyltransferase n=1 Tax=Luteitalea sp. TaxID=2004800 RepID=UPI0037CBCB45
MQPRVDLYDSAYGHFSARVLADVRARTYGIDIGQSGWVSVEEYATFIEWLGLSDEAHALDVGCGSGGPALHLARVTGCRVTGIDLNPHGIEAATAQAAAAGDTRAEFRVADVDHPLPFDAATFDAIVSMDAMCHMVQRAHVLAEWHRVLRPGGRALFTDPVVVTGPVTNEEVAVRASIGRFLFVPDGTNERFIAEAGLRLLCREDLSEGGARMAARWRDAREAYRDELEAVEGLERFEGLQRFLGVVARVMGERRLSRIAYLIERP